MDNKWSNDPTKPNYFSWASLRLGNVYGPRQVTKGEAGVVPIFIEKLYSQEVPTIFGSGKETRDYVHVHDVVSAFMTVFEKQQKKKLMKRLMLEQAFQLKQLMFLKMFTIP